MKPIAEDLHPGLYGQGEEVVRILRVEYNKELGKYDVDYVWLAGYGGRGPNDIIHAHLAPLAPWRLPELPFTIEEWP